MDQAAFELQLRQTLQGKAENAVIQPALQRDQWLQDLLRINSSGAQSTFDYNLKKRYEVLRVGNADRLIRKRKDTSEHEFKFVACVEEVFGIIKTAHEAIGHGGGKKTIAEEDLESFLEAETEAEAETGAEAEAATGAEAEEEAQTGAETEAEAETRAGRSEAEAETGAEAEAATELEAEEEAQTGAEAEAETGAEAEAGEEAEAETRAETVATNFQKIRVAANIGQSKAAARMTRRGKNLLKPLSIDHEGGSPSLVCHYDLVPPDVLLPITTPAYPDTTHSLRPLLVLPTNSALN
ncbi:hypothetical protein O3P69_003276 [Scylla paramamosain]|uniref:Uncharacterized protein n=1 Tax=Scylla paramamosain TaxID=85552 RepID=A0AAW0ULW3_SCYPA